MAKRANGHANDLASTVLLATDKKVLLAPAMNPKMWSHAATRRNRATLAKDGIAFANRERLLPVQPRGFYREYTVPTPGARDRGGRRIVCGGAVATAPDVCYYTADHYSSFHRITP